MSLLHRATECVAKQSAHQALNAFISRADPDAALRAVRAAAERAPPPPLAGKLVAVKDNICTLAHPTTCGSAMLRDYTPPYDATVVTQLAAAGAVVAGKTNLDEFGMGSHGTHSAFGTAANPADGLSAGGSSGGSAVAVATGQCWAALGTDTGGSVRLPASYCGVAGLKPSYGRVSRRGVVAYANSLDTVGVLARSAADARAVFAALDRHDPADPTSLAPATRARIAAALQARPRRAALRVGVPAELNVAELAAPVRAAWARTLQGLAHQGHAVQVVSLPSVRQALSAYYVLAPAEASSNLARYDGARYGRPAAGPRDPGAALFSRARGEGLGPEVRRRVLLGAYGLSAGARDNHFLQAQRVRRLLQRDFDRVFALANPLRDGDGGGGEEGVDVLVSPTAPTLAPALADVARAQPLDAYRDDVLTVPASLAGLPAMSVPVGLGGKEGGVRTTGMQVTAQFGDEEMVFRVAQLLEELGAQGLAPEI